MKNFKIGLLAFYSMSFGLVFAGPACSKSSTPLEMALKPEMIDISTLSKTDLYYCLFNATRLKEFQISSKEAQEIVGDESRKPLFVDLAKHTSKKLLIDISGNTIDVSLYNQRNGANKAQQAIEELINSACTCCSEGLGTEYFEHE